MQSGRAVGVSPLGIIEDPGDVGTQMLDVLLGFQLKRASNKVTRIKCLHG